MKDIQYKIKCFRINEETYKQLKEMKKNKNLSWNLLFLRFIKYEQNMQVLQGGRNGIEDK